MQASSEFNNRGLSVINCNSKAEFTKELNKSLSSNISSKSIGEICVVNIQNSREICLKLKMIIMLMCKGFFYR